jgi:hypothetical protein
MKTGLVVVNRRTTGTGPVEAENMTGNEGRWRAPSGLGMEWGLVTQAFAALRPGLSWRAASRLKGMKKRKMGERKMSTE